MCTESASDWAQGQILLQLWESKPNICNPLQSFQSIFPSSLLCSFSYTTTRKRATQIWFLLRTQLASLLSLSNQAETLLVNIWGLPEHLFFFFLLRNHQLNWKTIFQPSRMRVWLQMFQNLPKLVPTSYTIQFNEAIIKYSVCWGCPTYHLSPLFSSKCV